MESATTHGVTTQKTIQNTSDQPQEGSEQQTSEQQTKSKPISSERKTGPAVKRYPEFTLLDLERLTWTSDTETHNALDATHEQFSELANEVANVTNVETWDLEERRDFINGLYAFCQEHPALPFPFTIVDEQKTPTAPLSAEGA